MGGSREVSKEQSSCILGRCWWTPTASHQTAEPAQGEHRTNSADSISWYRCTHTNHECPEEARAKQTPVDECVWTLRSSSVLPYSQTQPLRKRVLFTKHRYLPLVCLFSFTLPKQWPPSMSSQKWNKVGERCSWTWLEVGWKPQKYTVWRPLKTTDWKKTKTHTDFGKVWKNSFLTKHHLVPRTGQGHGRQATVLRGKERCAQVCDHCMCVSITAPQWERSELHSVSFVSWMLCMNENILMYVQHKWKVIALVTWYFN